MEKMNPSRPCNNTIPVENIYEKDGAPIPVKPVAKRPRDHAKIRTSVWMMAAIRARRINVDAKKFVEFFPARDNSRFRRLSSTLLSVKPTTVRKLITPISQANNIIPNSRLSSEPNILLYTKYLRLTDRISFPFEKSMISSRLIFGRSTNHGPSTTRRLVF